jgi:hypothetical protein
MAMKGFEWCERRRQQKTEVTTQLSVEDATVTENHVFSSSQVFPEVSLCFSSSYHKS